MALQADIPTPQGPLHLICLPIQADNQFIAGLCLIQPSVAAFPLMGDVGGLPDGDPVAGSGVIPDRVEDDGFQGHYGLILDRSDLVARNASLLKRMVEERQWLGLVIEYSADGILIVDSECKHCRVQTRPFLASVVGRSKNCAGATAGKLCGFQPLAATPTAARCVQSGSAPLSTNRKKTAAARS